jgi:hypothetical protein
MRSILARLSPRRARLALAALFAAVGLGLVPGPDALAGVTISGAGVDVSAGPAVAGTPTTFKATAKFTAPSKGHGENEDPWVRTRWSFGDGSPVQNGGYGASGKLSDTIQHTFANPGTYTVVVTAGHGQTFLGFKYFTSKKFKVSVGCPGTDLGAKCPPGQFTPFTGIWTGGVFDPQLPQSGFHDNFAVCTFEQDGEKVIGTLSYRGLSGNQVTIDVEGSPTYKRFAGGKEALELRGKTKVDGEKVEYAIQLKVDTAAGRASSPNSQAYRRLALLLQPAPDTPVGLAKALLAGAFDLDTRLDDLDTDICMTLGASVPVGKTAKPGQSITFVVSVQATGPASIPAERVGVSVQITGATINPEQLASQRMVSGSATGSSAVGLLGALGGGAGQKNARAKFIVTADVDDDASKVECLVHLTPELGGPDVKFGNIRAGPDRKMCIAVDQSGE